MKEFVLRVTEAEGNLLVQALAEMPFRVSAGLIANLQGQVQQQIEQKTVEQKTVEQKAEDNKE